MTARTRLVALLLFGSGFCALIYQTTWLREFRLVFGVSTAATAAVVGVFMAGMGLGGIFLGRRSERAPQPLRFYANLEFAIAVTAACSPILILAVRHLYIVLGGTATLGVFFGTIIRLAFAAVIVGAPTFLMGGTLPAAVRAATSGEDRERRAVGFIYGANTLGAVAGACAGTFYLFENIGDRLTLWLAAIANILIATAALKLSGRSDDLEGVTKVSTVRAHDSESLIINRRFVLIAAALVGFAFFLMELVWYRMLAPLLGGSTFSFGLILAVALLGIGFGGIAYGTLFRRRAISLQFFAMTCASEAFFIALPYALGDRIPLLAMLLRPLSTLGFQGYLLGWTALCLIVVFPGAFVAGIQFPALIALLGEGKKLVGSQTGAAYAWNTIGALAGSIAGGFGFIPLFSAPGVWKLVTILLAALGAFTALFGLWQKSIRWGATIAPTLVSLAGISMLATTGPTAFWRHSEIGVGHLVKLQGSPNEMQELILGVRRRTIWETDGIESSVALTSNGLAFILNGRADGSAKSDAGTQIMIGMIGAALHPHSTKALVIGLGTGSTAGWLGVTSGIERVDVVELEPAIVNVAERCSPVNQNVLRNPKVHLTFGDAREYLLTSREKYDIIVSEPSNPYRAGIASLFTREYYQAVDRCLSRDGMFFQWLPVYEIDDRMIEIIYRTLGSVFTHIESWQTTGGDLLLAASHSSTVYDVDALRSRLASEPFKSALLNAWRGATVEEFLGHYVGNETFAQTLGDLVSVPLNTDDRTVLEFAFARTAGQTKGFQIPNLRQSARAGGADRPLNIIGNVDWPLVDETQLSSFISLSRTEQSEPQRTFQQRARAAAFVNYCEGNLTAAWRDWRGQSEEPKTLSELAMVAECAAVAGDSAAPTYIEKLSELLPSEAEAIRAEFLWRTQQFNEAVDNLEKFLRGLRNDPWPNRDLISRSLTQAQVLATSDRSKIVAGFFNTVLRDPFCILNNDSDRMTTRLAIATYQDGDYPGNNTRDALKAFEPHILWQREFLEIRKKCYAALRDPRAAQASRDFESFMQREAATLDVATLAREIQARSANRGTP